MKAGKLYHRSAALVAAVALALGSPPDVRAQGRAQAPAVAALRVLSTQGWNLRTPEGAAFQRRFLAEGTGLARQNGCLDDERLPFDRLCQSYGTDDEMPDLMVGIKNEHIFAAILPGTSGQALGKDWRCKQVLHDYYAVCFPTDTDIQTEMRWTDQITAFLGSLG
ncbi:hypothetical protein JQK15_20065 [Sphingobium sp. BHU LFT2]|uniref:hypothetical protein n=1 Tax=Sphingobium sp. BHU LFT2 TaxID=2807634 RepID=UPI001BE75F08|nr:hypothetical protein [Sphingobium sp. BHU LFT2]MBT2245813.1 hypothetical protein [Sphingobium sp. BHU LFT2]